MDAPAWLGLEPTHNRLRWYLPVVPGISTGAGFLFGGCGLGAAIAALEGSTGRPIVWATAQYLSYARPDEVMDIDVTVAAEGRLTTQARAVGTVAGTEILTVNAALGERPLATSSQWAKQPVVPPPSACPPRERRWNTESIMTRLEQRWALVDGEAGRVAVWTRMPELLEMSAPALAVLGDYVPMAMHQAIEGVAMANSLDNTLRVGRVVPTEWVLADIQIDLVAKGFGHGRVNLWSEDGTLLATASQSTLIRMEKPPESAH
jgi:acyl-CoA thioesterase II